MSEISNIERAARIADEYAAENRRLADECQERSRLPAHPSDLTPEMIERITLDMTMRISHLARADAAEFLAERIRELKDGAGSTKQEMVGEFKADYSRLIALDPKVEISITTKIAAAVYTIMRRFAGYEELSHRKLGKPTKVYASETEHFGLKGVACEWESGIRNGVKLPIGATKQDLDEAVRLLKNWE